MNTQNNILNDYWCENEWQLTAVPIATPKKSDSSESDLERMIKAGVFCIAMGAGTLSYGSATPKTINEVTQSMNTSISFPINTSRRKGYSDDYHFQNIEEFYTSELMAESNMRFDIEVNLIKFEGLQDNWDGLGSFAPHVKTITRTKNFLRQLDYKYLSALDPDNGIILNSHGTISVEWFVDDHNLVSVEIGSASHNFFAFINGTPFTSNEFSKFDNGFFETLTRILSKVVPLDSSVSAA